MQLQSISCGDSTNEQPDVIRRIIVQGTAGTGKSTVIKQITQKLSQTLGPSSYQLLAPTGVAAHNVGGKTVHSVLRIPVDKSSFLSLSGNAERSFQLDFQSCHFILIDEYSMIGCSMMNKIDKRLRQAKPNCSNSPFGNMFVYLFGDIMQLPPVLDRPLYSQNISEAASTNEGYLAYRSFSHCQVLSVNQRQSGDSVEQTNFRDILHRISRGTSSHDDWTCLSGRFETAVPETERQRFRSAIQLEPTRKQVTSNNLAQLLQLHRPIAKIVAKHNCSSAKEASEDVAQGLAAFLYLSVGCRVMLRSTLWVEQGLVHGRLGTVMDIVYAPNLHPPEYQPVCVLVAFDNYSGPYYHTPGVFPITPVTRSWSTKGTSCSRTGFPLILAWSMTVHKCQGLQLSEVNINIGRKEMAPGLTFVALSRVRRLGDILFRFPFPYERLISIGRMKAIRQRVLEEERLHSLSLPTNLLLPNH